MTLLQNASVPSYQSPQNHFSLLYNVHSIYGLLFILPGIGDRGWSGSPWEASLGSGLSCGHSPRHVQVVFFFPPGFGTVCLGCSVSPLLGFYSICSYSFHFNTWMVTHPSSYRGPSCLTSVFLRELPTWYSRRLCKIFSSSTPEPLSQFLVAAQGQF